jgi:hypothetical protein
VKFDATEIQGAWQGPDTGVVTGDVERGGFDLLSLRDSFRDRQATSVGLSAGAAPSAAGAQRRRKAVTQ